MGSCFSRSSSSSSLNCVRIVHLNGYIEDFEDPITVKQVTADLPKHFLCTTAHLVYGSKPIGPEVKLQTGCIYFLLPYSILRSDTSPANMVALATKLTAYGRSNRSSAKTNHESLLNLPASKGNSILVSTNCEYSLRPARVERSSTVTKWKPILDAITEKSMEHLKTTSCISDQLRED
ncbi:hypothetical protein AQUCO_01800108v1 [Aquilegia coerulea]|uniref:DUF4228 domain-containing protein n=1 Tax=Aquilegia coerulea TaxID=218851 RepID=A0A2G5DK13_AQUCA|nr:hypothetical protein AQUCO_01800108v1 [Aquilegia coerulea]